LETGILILRPMKLIPYLVCAAIMLGTGGKEEPQKIELTNTDAL